MQSPAYFGRLRAFYELAMMHGIEARNVAIGIWITMGRLGLSLAVTSDEPEPDDPGSTADEHQDALDGDEPSEQDDPGLRTPVQISGAAACSCGRFGRVLRACWRRS